MKRKLTRPTEFKVAANDYKLRVLMQYPQEAIKARGEKLKGAVINPEGACPEGTSQIPIEQMFPRAQKMIINSSEKKNTLKQFPMKNHFLATPSFKRSDLAVSQNINLGNAFYTPRGDWNKSTKHQEEFQGSQKALPSANYFSSERKIICSVFDVVEEAIDIQLFSETMMKVLKQREIDVELAKEYKRFKRRQHAEVVQQLKEAAKELKDGENEIILEFQYNLSDVWAIWKAYARKNQIISETSEMQDELENSEFVCFLRDIGVKSVYDSNNFFKEMATTTNTPLSNLPKTVLKMELFINNFEKFTYRNHKVLYLHSSNAVAMRNLTLQMYLQQWKERKQSMKEKMKHKRKQEETYFKFLKDLYKSEEDDIIFQLEDQLAIRQEILKKGVLKKKQYPYLDAVSMIEKQLTKTQNDISTVYKCVVSKLRSEQEGRDNEYRKKKTLCALIIDQPAISQVHQFLTMCSSKIEELESSIAVLDDFGQSILQEKKEFQETFVCLREVGEYVFERNLGQEQISIIQRLITQMKRIYKQTYVSTGELPPTQKISMSIFENALTSCIKKLSTQAAFIQDMLRRINHEVIIQANKVGHNQKHSAGLNALFDYLLKTLCSLDASAQRQDDELQLLTHLLQKQVAEDTNAVITSTELDVNKKYNNRLECIVYQIFAAAGDQLPDQLRAMIGSRQKQHQEFMRVLAETNTLTYSPYSNENNKMDYNNNNNNYTKSKGNSINHQQAGNNYENLQDTDKYGEANRKEKNIFEGDLLELDQSVIDSNEFFNNIQRSQEINNIHGNPLMDKANRIFSAADSRKHSILSFEEDNQSQDPNMLVKRIKSSSTHQLSNQIKPISNTSNSYRPRPMTNISSSSKQLKQGAIFDSYKVQLQQEYYSSSTRQKDLKNNSIKDLDVPLSARLHDRKHLTGTDRNQFALSKSQLQFSKIHQNLRDSSVSSRRGAQTDRGLSANNDRNHNNILPADIDKKVELFKDQVLLEEAKKKIQSYPHTRK